MNEMPLPLWHYLVSSVVVALALLAMALVARDLWRVAVGGDASRTHMFHDDVTGDVYRMEELCDYFKGSHETNPCDHCAYLGSCYLGQEWDGGQPPQQAGGSQ